MEGHEGTGKYREEEESHDDKKDRKKNTKRRTRNWDKKNWDKGSTILSYCCHSAEKHRHIGLPNLASNFRRHRQTLLAAGKILLAGIKTSRVLPRVKWPYVSLSL
ncbi:hypothetical protein Pcinc_010557 [Petrolisthes cinctipes]|uniref:Uncharacterized protein n=1 Tax=Petrolisthes cinctipes TaxID=88211 RepID=A0AAE1G8S8_PETCI|nr:hypothetical protein Pcinc_010557 [Petrolisthes cinctipes]